jgi:hypothetical protein
MNKKEAYKILQIDITESIPTESDIKRQYHIMALKYHPDKNPSPDAMVHFIKIKEAYDLLVENPDCTYHTENSYVDLLQNFLKNVWKKENQGSLFSIIIEKIVHYSEYKIVELLERVDKTTIIAIYDVFSKYRDSFHYSEDFLEKIKEVLSKKIQQEEYIILNPSIDDLFECNLYRMIVQDETYIVPLWQHELVYDNHGKEIYIECNPIVSDNISIDTENNIHMFSTYDIKDIWNKKTIDFSIGKNMFSILSETLLLKQNQIIMLKQKGIPKPNLHDIYDISQKSDIYLHIELVCL